MDVFHFAATQVTVPCDLRPFLHLSQTAGVHWLADAVQPLLLGVFFLLLFSSFFSNSLLCIQSKDSFDIPVALVAEACLCILI